MRAAVVGAGISGLAAAYALSGDGVQVVVYEKEEKLGGHAKTITFDGVDVGLAFILFNRVNYPNVVELFERLGVEMEPSDMSFSVSLDDEQGMEMEWSSNSLSGLFAHKNNLVNPFFWQMLRQIIKLDGDVKREVMELGLGLDQKFIRIWEYYLDYCAASFKSRVLGDYQIVFSRPGNNTTFRSIYESFPSA